MAEPANRDPGVAGSSTEESAETLRRREAALLRQTVHEAYCRIPPGLYLKARDQVPLTEDERAVFLGCGDVLGRVIAHPESATIDEVHEACAWPPPDVVRANIQRATGGRLGTPTELYAKAKDALDRGEFDALISDEEALLIDAGSNPLSLDGSWSNEGDMGFSSLWWAVEIGWTELTAEMIKKWAPNSNADEILHGSRPEGVYPTPTQARSVQKAALAHLRRVSKE